MYLYRLGLDFVVNFFATVLGVFLAFFLQRRYDAGKDKIKAKDNIEKTKENLIAELDNILSSFKEKEWADIIHFDTPVWKSVIATGSILDIIREDGNIHDKLHGIYGKLFGLKKLQKKFSENEKKILKLRTEIENEILEVRKQWQKKQSQSKMKKMCEKLTALQMRLKNCRSE